MFFQESSWSVSDVLRRKSPKFSREFLESSVRVSAVLQGVPGRLGRSSGWLRSF
jgi:hypothetical protein